MSYFSTRELLDGRRSGRTLDSYNRPVLSIRLRLDWVQSRAIIKDELPRSRELREKLQPLAESI